MRQWHGGAIEGKSGKTGREYVNTIASMFHYARDLALIPASMDPVAELRRTLRRKARTKQGRGDADLSRDVRPVTDPAALARLVKQARIESTEAYVFTLLLLDAGLRLGEALGLRWGSIVWGLDADDVGRHLRIVESRPRGAGEPVLPKSGRARSVPLSRRLRAALLAFHLERGRPADDDFVLDGLDPSNFAARVEVAGS